MSTGFIYDDRYLTHDTGPGHPERPERLGAIVTHLRNRGLLEKLQHLEPQPADAGWIEAVHPPAHRQRIQTLAANGGGYLDANTVVSSQSYDVAMRAAGGVAGACDMVARSDWRNAFCAVRPPGHHAERDRAMGFCLFNNVAIGARYLQSEPGIGKIAIVDWDVHHGNGTQHIFEDDPTVLYISLHQYPLYPGTGLAAERGIGAGEGFTLNLPLPAGSGDREYRAAFDRVLDRLDEFAPEFIMISAGFDAHRDDPLAGMNLDEESYRWMARDLLNAADRHCGGRLVAVLEGGYNMAALGRSAGVCIEEMLEEE
jgi:acetoin utilization deacetylase AcuC-like enzyme